LSIVRPVCAGAVVAGACSPGFSSHAMVTLQDVADLRHAAEDALGLRPIS
jgi:hypothetical protein